MMDLKEIITLEDKLIYESVTDLLSQLPPLSSIKKEDIEKINAKVPSIASAIHYRIISNLICSYISYRFPILQKDICKICFDINIEECEVIQIKDIQSIPLICEGLHIAFLNSKFQINQRNKKVRSKSKEQLIELGAVYTQSHIANDIVKGTLENLSVSIEKAKILDFACGTGRFYEQIVSHFENKTYAILNNIYALDIDKTALHITKLKALTYFDKITIDECQIISNHIILRNGLRKNDLFFPEPLYISAEDFDGLTEARFDAIVSNPPYLVLKPNKSKEGVGTVDNIQEQVTYYRNSGIYVYSIEGMLNLYQLSIERMLQMLKSNGVLGIICPSTLFGDVSATKLRKHLLLQNNVLYIKFFAERIPIFENVNQATNIFILKKGIPSKKIIINEENETFEVDIELVKELFPKNLEIPAIKASEWKILKKLSSLKKLKQISSIRNRRGELDLTLCKNYITKQPTTYRLVRGNMIGDSEIKDINGEYVEESFIDTRSKEFKNYDLNKKRLICQQISNGGLKRRLRFIYCSQNDILGNSCNYISSDEETLCKLNILLNSSILNWRFKITSSNNHINNYELDELPIVDLKKVDPTFSYSTQKELDEYVGALYGLTKEELQLIEL